MRTATLPGIMLVACTYAASAQQITVLPQIGFEVSRTTLRYNNLASFAPVNNQSSRQLGIRMDYTVKQGHGVFAGVATSRSGVVYNFSDPSTGMKNYNASVGNLRLNFQTGYQFSTKPIFFKKTGSIAKTATAAAPAPMRSAQSRCGRSSYYSSRCTKSSPAARAMTPQAAPTQKGWSLILHPLAGVALTSAVNPQVTTEIQGGQSVHQYQAGNWNTAMIVGSAFEFGKNDERKFTISMNYLRVIGNLGTSTIATTVNGKTTTTHLTSGVSSFNVTAGIPLTIYKKKTQVKEVKLQAPPAPLHRSKSRYEGKCGRYFRYQGVI